MRTPEEQRAQEDEVDTVLAILTHELSTPLTVITGYAEMLERRVEESGGEDGPLADLRPAISAIQRSADTIIGLVQALAEARGPGVAGDPKAVDLATFVPGVLAEMGPLLAGHRLELTVAERNLVVLADPCGLRQILTNLLANATKFAPAGTCVAVNLVRGDGDTVVMTVSDEGPGVPRDREHELFARFSRLGSTRKGLGLGLHLSRLVARRHGGDLRLHRPERAAGAPGGAAFVLELPGEQATMEP